MIKFSSWARVLITWVVLTSDLLLSYLYLRNPCAKLEMLSLSLNFVATTSIYYIYMNIAQDVQEDAEDEEEESRNVSSEEKEKPVSFYRLNFGPLIEDMGVWLILFFLLYNVIPVTLYVHSWAAKNIIGI